LGSGAPARAAEPAEIPWLVDLVEDALTGKSLSDKELVPRHFIKAAEAKGDLNGDNIDDLALILRWDPKVKRPLPKNDDGDQVDDSGSQLVAIFAGEKTGKYVLWTVDDGHFEAFDNSPGADNSVGLFQIKKGVLSIGSEPHIGGSTFFSDCTTKWRNSPEGLRLIGLTVMEADRACACGSTTDTNFLTGVQLSESDEAPGRQHAKRSQVKTKGKPKVILWQNFSWDDMCTPSE
jgi:hypothetical protein